MVANIHFKKLGGNSQLYFMRKIYFTILLIIVNALTVFNCAIYAQEFVLDLRENLQIGKELSDTSGYMFSEPRLVLVTQENEIIISDKVSNSIRKFDKNGIFITQTGGRGRGPSEFQEITDMKFSNDGRIMVVDKLLNRISFFDHNLNYINTKTININTQVTLEQIYQLDTDSYLLLYFRNLWVKENAKFLHKVNSELDQIEFSAIDIMELFDSNSDLEISMVYSPMYQSTQFGRKKIGIVPYIYTGQIFVFEGDREGRILGKKLESFYSMLSANEFKNLYDNNVPGVSSRSGRFGAFYFQKKGINLALIGNRNFLLHFYILFEKGSQVINLNIYNSEGAFLKHVQLKEESLEFFKNGVIRIFPKYIDDNNTIYFTDRYYKNGFPVVRIFNSNLDVLLKKNTN